MPTTWTRATAVKALESAAETGRLDRSRVVPALDALAAAAPDDEVTAAVVRFAAAMLDGRFEERRHADILEQCVRLLGRTQERRALDVYRAASALELPTP